MTETTTPRLALPLLQPGQAQKEMTHNEALALLDIAVHARVLGTGENVPPESAAPGDCWIVGPAPTGAWIGHRSEIAGWTAAGWRFVAPQEGMALWCGAMAGIARYVAGEWHVGAVHGKLFVEGVQVVGPRAPSIAEPSGGMTVDAEARAALNAVLVALRAHGLVDAT